MKKLNHKQLLTWDCYVCRIHFTQRHTESFIAFNDRVFNHTETHRKGGIYPNMFGGSYHA